MTNKNITIHDTLDDTDPRASQLKLLYEDDPRYTTGKALLNLDPYNAASQYGREIILTPTTALDLARHLIHYVETMKTAHPNPPKKPTT